jgi:hypothetical protein
MDGIPLARWYASAADDITRMRDGEYHLIQPIPPAPSAGAPASDVSDHEPATEIEPPF